MVDALYNDRILDLAAGLVKQDRLDDPDASVTVTSALCGSRVKVDLKMKDGVITDFGQDVRACALGQSSAALMKQIVVGQTPDRVAQAAREMRAMLKEEGDPPSGPWSVYEVLIPARDHRSRHASILLPFDGVEKAIAEIRKADAAKAGEGANAQSA
ncbi:iron-sulfur cluster assembly scaffold protein [Hwanghaeella grinnelliae]|uniref:Iron-sulfur cluster assembly scaffold protein n=1 Tax=Hwanghaeella grinnelliae TaxID=2500179 RepID=A0A437QTK6_9PROT|nr:iron-sulfur cluster assembly scaffold protein [Hwanghaeella grinnelliae]RVU37824.1 iron-sulfur cluster assembly scaffold protein [Hwanghaeella grinnelliae]